MATSYWIERYLAFGHTGWRDPIIYAYDQEERLALIRRVIPGGSAGRIAFDFGCGTGDFSRLLLADGFIVHGMDPYVKPRIRSPSFFYASTIEEIKLSLSEVDFVLCVTTLDHILSLSDLGRVLRMIHMLLKKDGVMVMLEYALDSELHGLKCGLQTNEYQSFRTTSDYTDLLRTAGLTITSISNAPSPALNPSAGYSAYTRSRLVRAYRKLPRRLASRRCLHRILRWHAKSFVSPIPIQTEPEAPSPMKLMCCRKC